jgi:hypothetical protein
LDLIPSTPQLPSYQTAPQSTHTSHSVDLTMLILLPVSLASLWI